MPTSRPHRAAGTRSDHHVVVVGASMAGLAAAGVLASKVREVTIIERDAILGDRPAGASTELASRPSASDRTPSNRSPRHRALSDRSSTDQTSIDRTSIDRTSFGPTPGGASVGAASTEQVAQPAAGEHAAGEAPTLASRPATPQARHAHALLAAGRAALERTFGGIDDEIVARGGLVVDGAANNIWYQLGGRRVRYQSEVDGICVSRPLLEQVVRDRVRALPNVVVIDRASVQRLRFSVDGRSVVGVTIRRGDVDVDLRADLVVDAGGRNAPLLDQLVEAGYPEIPTDRVKVDIAYASRVVERRPGDLGGADYLVAMASPPYGRGGIVLPIEGDRWIVTLNGSHGDRPPTDAEGFEAFARTIAVPELGELVARNPADGAVPHRFPASQRRRFERVRAHPAGFVAIGDAVCSFNPAYGQGMTSAVLQAERLGAAVDRHGVTGAAMPRAAYRAMAKVVETPWRIAVGSDFIHPLTTGPKPRGTDLVNRYMKQVLLASLVSPDVNERMVRVQNLLAPPTSLFRPDVAIRAWRGARRARAAMAPASSTPAAGARSGRSPAPSPATHASVVEAPAPRATSAGRPSSQGATSATGSGRPAPTGTPVAASPAAASGPAARREPSDVGPPRPASDDSGRAATSSTTGAMAPGRARTHREPGGDALARQLSAADVRRWSR